jgi:MATE family multidrug resistance protein
MTYMGVWAAAMLIFREPMLRLFADGVNNTPDVADRIVAVGGGIMVAAAIFQIFDALGIVLIGALRGAGDTLWPGVMTVILSWSLIVGLGWLMVEYAPELGPVGPWVAAAVYIGVFGGMMLWRWRSGAWRKIRLLGAAEGPQEPAQ